MPVIGGKEDIARICRDVRSGRLNHPDSVRHQYAGMSGLEMLPKTKAVRPNVPAIMITAYGDAETKRKALEGGAEALFTSVCGRQCLLWR
jgi:CheY-like chemotaxis protein